MIHNKPPNPRSSINHHRGSQQTKKLWISTKTHWSKPRSTTDPNHKTHKINQNPLTQTLIHQTIKPKPQSIRSKPQSHNHHTKYQPTKQLAATDSQTITQQLSNPKLKLKTPSSTPDPSYQNSNPKPKQLFATNSNPFKTKPNNPKLKQENPISYQFRQ